MSNSHAFPWENTFYDPDFFDCGAGNADDGEMVKTYLSKLGGEPCDVLDIGCGTGRLSIPMCLAGHRVHAIDNSERMLNALRAKQKRLNVADTSLHTELVDVVDWTAVEDQRFDAAVAADDFLTHFLNAEVLLKVLRNLRRLLRSGGRLLTDLRAMAPARLKNALRPFPKTPVVYPVVGGYPVGGGEAFVAMTEVESYDTGTKVLTSMQRFEIVSVDGSVLRSEYKTIRQRLYSSQELNELASTLGLVRVEAHARQDPGRKPSRSEGAFIVWQVL